MANLAERKVVHVRLTTIPLLPSELPTEKTVPIIPIKRALRPERAVRAALADNPDEPLLSDKVSYPLGVFQRTTNRTFTDKDVQVLLRVATSLLLAALLIFQSVTPCCAISKLLAGDGGSEAVATQLSQPCSCCPHSQSQQEPVPSDTGHSPDGKCPYCGGPLFHSGLDDAIPISEGHLVFALLGDAPKQLSGQAPAFPQTLQRQVFGRPFLNTGMRLLI